MAKVGTLVTSFDMADGATMPSDWTELSGLGSAGISSNRLALTSGASAGNYGAVSTPLTAWDLTSSAMYCRVTLPGSGNYTFGLAFTAESGDGWKFLIDATNGLRVCHVISSVLTAIYTVAYNATNHRWLRIRGSATAVFFDVAPDLDALAQEPGSWTEVATEAFSTVAGINAAAALPSLANYYNITANSVVYVDGFNTYAGTPFAVVTGTATASITRRDVFLGNKTLILTLTGDTYVAAGATFNAQRQALVNGVTAATSQRYGWNNVVKATLPVTAVVRTSDTVVTVTLTGMPAYVIDALETGTATIPASILTAAAPIVATPTFTVTPDAARLSHWGTGGTLRRPLAHSQRS